jgi:hypothetical protein
METQSTQEWERRQPNPPEAERVCVVLWTLIAACNDMLDAHEKPDGTYCDCNICEDTYGLRYNAKAAESIIGGELTIWPAYLRKRAAEMRAEGEHVEAAWYEARADHDDHPDDRELAQVYRQTCRAVAKLWGQFPAQKGENLKNAENGSTCSIDQVEPADNPFLVAHRAF